MSRLRRNISTSENTNTATEYTPKVYNYNTPEAKPNKPIHISKVRYDKRPRSYEKKSNKPATFYQEAPKTRTLYASEEDEEIVYKQSNKEDEFFMNNELYGYHIEQMVGTKKNDLTGTTDIDHTHSINKAYRMKYGYLPHFIEPDNWNENQKDVPCGSLQEVKIIKHTEGRGNLKFHILAGQKRKDKYFFHTRELTEKELDLLNEIEKENGGELKVGKATVKAKEKDKLPEDADAELKDRIIGSKSDIKALFTLTGNSIARDGAGVKHITTQRLKLK